MVGSIKKVRGVGLGEVYWRISQNPMVIGRPVNLLNISLLTIRFPYSQTCAKVISLQIVIKVSNKGKEFILKFKMNICFQILQIANISLVPS